MRGNGRKKKGREEVEIMKEKGMGREKSKGKGKGREMLFQVCFVGRLAETGIFFSISLTILVAKFFFFFS